MSNPEPGLRRVAVYTETGHADLTLPSTVPVTTLITAVADLFPGPSGPEALRPYRLCEPGKAALDGAKTLAQHGIRDGSTLVLSRAESRAPQVMFDDPAEQVAAAVRATERPWGPAARRLTAALAASGLAGVAGFVVVPGRPGAPNALLAVAAAGVVALTTVPPRGDSGPLRTTLRCLAALAVLTAVAGVAVAATGMALQAAGALAVLAAIGLIRVGGRLAAMSRRPPNDAHHLLTGLVTAAAALAMLGAVGVATGTPVGGTPGTVGVVFVAAVGTAVTLRARSHTDGTQIAVLVAAGTAVIGIALLDAAVCVDHRWPAVAALAGAAAAIGLGFAAPDCSPAFRRAAELAEGLTLGALAPLACCLCGLYSAARGLSLG